MKTSLRIVSVSLVLFLICSLFSCTPASDESSPGVPVSGTEVSSEESQVQRTSAQAYEMLYGLLGRDRKIVGIFVGGSLFSDGLVNVTTPDTLSSYPLKSSCEYNDFSVLENEISSLYSDGASALTDFYTYPLYGEKSLSVVDGTVRASLNGKRDFSYPDYDSFSLKTLDFSEAVFEFAYGGRKYTVKVDFENEKLSDSVYMLVQKKYSGEWETNPSLDGTQNSGSASKLSGKVLVINVFMDDAKSSWSATERNEILAMQKKGVAILEKQAQEYGVELDFTLTGMVDSLLYKHKDTVGTTPEDHIWINEMFAYTTYGTLEEYISGFYDLTPYDSYCVFFLLNKSGESYSVMCDEGNFDASLYTAERSVVFYDPKQDNGNEASASLFAHEILHMFGATELDTDNARNYFPYDLMADKTVAQDKARIDDYTAFRIGWLSGCDSFLMLDGLLTVEAGEETE